ncbi:serine/threonine-protein kinase [Nonomuraea turcica]|uniref:serine/threonine-protein kinase n=1 Tax=Nonomuraea sp. G32 TaxID=3067274 RepID=UPI00273CAE67|nr:serine/threonine-protein kinase [Nonomuraea sp. G32]MDP4506533.1 serine/threonine-protein kinase [Nonomuraea sp. G32]
MPQISPLMAGDPTHLGSFRLSGRVGEGGQGIVYLGVNDEGERAAIKLLHVKFSGDTIARSRFARELKAAQRVASFCTARVIEADLDGDTPYIASEYIDGRSLRDIVDTDGPLTGTALDRLAIGTATALTAIHHAHIVHRDFKPDNVLIAADGPRVVDFGIARIIDSTGTITSRAIGTPAYMAPEQIAGDDIGPYTDVFSWGATIAFAATGKAVFEGKSIATVLNRILNHEVDVGMMPEPLRSVVGSALAKAAVERPSADQILLRLLGQSTGVGASTAVLTRGVQVASDDTTPFMRVSAGSITDRGSASLVPSQPGPAAQEEAPVSGPGAVTGQRAVSVMPGGYGGGSAPPDAGRAPNPTTEPSGPPRRRRAKVWIAFGTALVLVAAAALALALNGWSPPAFDEEPEPTQEPTRSFASVADKVAQTGKIVIGVKGDLPGIGLQDGDDFQGFDIEIAKRIAAGLGATETQFVRVSRDDRPLGLAEGRMDLVVATFAVDKGPTEFAGPYYVAHRDVMVLAGSGIDALEDLENKRICAPNSPTVGDVQDRVKVKPVPAADMAICMDKLRSGEVDAIPGEDLILAGFANRENHRYKILGAKLSNERYAVGVRNGDAKTCKAVNGIIADLYSSGQLKQLIAKYFGKVDFKPELEQPAMETCR